MVCLLWRTTWYKSNFSPADKQLVVFFIFYIMWDEFYSLLLFIMLFLCLSVVSDLCLFGTFLLDNLLKNMLTCSWDKKRLTEQAKFNLDVKNKVFIVFLWIKVKTRYNTSKRNLKNKDCITLSIKKKTTTHRQWATIWQVPEFTPTYLP